MERRKAQGTEPLSFSITRQLDEAGEPYIRYALPGAAGEMRIYAVYPGIRMAFNDFRTDLPLPEEHDDGWVMEINYCLRGCHACEFADRTSSFIGNGDFCVNMFDHPPFEERFPTGEYEGIGIYIDMEAAAPFLSEGVPGVSIDIEAITRRLRLDRAAFYLKKSPLINRLFGEIYRAGGPARMETCRLKLLELLVCLEREDLPLKAQRQKYYPTQAVRAAKAVHRRITENYSVHTPVEMLAREQGVSATVLKGCFQALYGAPIYACQKRYRMQVAAKCLRDGRMSVAEVAERVGYENAGKFSEAFRRTFGCTPSAYRRTDLPEKINVLLD